MKEITVTAIKNKYGPSTAELIPNNAEPVSSDRKEVEVRIVLEATDNSPTVVEFVPSNLLPR